MTKKFILTFLFCLLLSNNSSMAITDNPRIYISPKTKITTAKDEWHIGDRIEFRVIENVYLNNRIYIKKGSIAKGTITHLKNNSWLGENAEMTIENFQTINNYNKKVNLKGKIFKDGSDHGILLSFAKPMISFLAPIQFLYESLICIRGGEVQIKPYDDLFMLFIEN